MRKEQSSHSSDNSAGSGTTHGKVGSKVPCSICKEAAHNKWFKCSQRVYRICRETVHDPNKYPKVAKEEASLAIRIKRA